MSPISGSLDVGPLVAAAPRMPGLGTEPLVLEGAEVLQVMYELTADGMEALLPRALHPTIPPTATFVFYRCRNTPIGSFTLGQVRVGCRAGVRPRGYLLRAFVDDDAAAAELAGRWGYRCAPGEVELRRSYTRIEGVASAGGTTVLEASLEDPEPISGGDLLYVASMHLASVDGRARLVQVDPEFAFHKAERGRPRLAALDAEAFGEPRLRPVHPVSASWTVCDITLPRIRYVCDPDVPALQGTEKVTPEG